MTHDTPPLPTLEIIAHIWAGQLWQYAHFAHLQLSSLFLHPPARCHVRYVACHSAEDEITAELVHKFFWRAAQSGTITIEPHVMPTDRLMRRAIGRNECARQSTGDVVYFAGCDYFWGAGALDAIAEASLANPGNLIFPRHIQRHQKHAYGEQIVSASRAAGFGELVDIDSTQFEPCRIPRAIGCLQIVPGKVARDRGYLPDSRKFQRPAGRWQRTFEDTAARNWFGLPSLGVEIPNVYRFRHEKQGRFVDGEGNVLPPKRRRMRVRLRDRERGGD